MEQIEMIEKLREKADVTYDEAKGVLESVGWNLLDALIALEKEGKIKEAEKMSYSTKSENTNNYCNYNCGNGKPESFGSAIKRFGKWCEKVISKGMENKFCVEKKGKKIIDIPVTVLVIFMIPAFYLIICALIVAFFMGCKFRFIGPDLGTEKVNNVMDKIECCQSKKENNGQNINVDDRK
jgi:hypothetical protein